MSVSNAVLNAVEHRIRVYEASYRTLSTEKENTEARLASITSKISEIEENLIELQKFAGDEYARRKNE